jgi:hypothetical protein
VTCRPASGASRVYLMLPDRPVSEGLHGDKTAPGILYLGFLASMQNLPFGSCGTDNRAQELWSGPSGNGQLACVNPYDGRPWIYFSFGKGKYLGFATRDDSNFRALHEWWLELKTFLQ